MARGARASHSGAGICDKEALWALCRPTSGGSDHPLRFSQSLKFWTPEEAAQHGHSPLDSVGEEGTAHLTPKVEKAMIKELKKHTTMSTEKAQSLT